MRHVLVISSALLISTASIALAQSGAAVPLDEQMRRLQKGSAAAADPMGNAPAEAPRKNFTVTEPVKPMAAPKTGTTMKSSGGAVIAPRTPGLKPGETIDSVGSGAIPALPIELVTENGVSYLSGGIGDEEIEQMKAQEAQFNLHITITNDSGDFASSVVLNLKNASGKTLISVNDAGPKLLVRLHAGHYTVETNVGGAVKTLSVNVPAKGAAKSQIRI